MSEEAEVTGEAGGGELHSDRFGAGDGLCDVHRAARSLTGLHLK